VHLLEEISMHSNEELARLRRPSPPEVVGDLPKTLECCGEARDDGIMPKRGHVATSIQTRGVPVNVTLM
jgi:hypothetical protein